MIKFKEVLFLYKNKILLILIFCLVSIISFAGIYIFKTEKTTSEYIEFNSNNEDTEEHINTTSEIQNKETIKVDIKGEIKNPGVYEFCIDSRINDVIKKAGGLTSKADTSVLNLSKKITDEMVIIVYSIDEVKKFSDTKVIETQENINCKNSDKLENDACLDNENSTNSEIKNTKININIASIDELMNLEGIGRAKAQAIIDYRNNFGKFEKIEDIQNVSGIGQSLFDKIKKNITV